MTFHDPFLAHFSSEVDLSYYTRSLASRDDVVVARSLVRQSIHRRGTSGENVGKDFFAYSLVIGTFDQQVVPYHMIDILKSSMPGTYMVVELKYRETLDTLYTV